MRAEAATTTRKCEKSEKHSHLLQACGRLSQEFLVLLEVQRNVDTIFPFLRAAGFSGDF